MATATGSETRSTLHAAGWAEVETWGVDLGWNPVEAYVAVGTAP
jgi:hypothetical protein